MKAISVLQIGEICGVSRSTVSYWIAKRSLPASRSGKKHMVAVDDLILFLKSEGRSIPKMLLNMRDGDLCVPFIPFKKCWEYWKDDDHGTRCKHCNVFTHQIQPCFIAMNNRIRLCPHDCNQCRYFDEYYEPQTAFIHQIGKPSAICQGLYFWACNRSWAQLCGLAVNKMQGIGIEEIFHPQSLKLFLNYFKKTNQGGTTIPDKCEVVLSYKDNEMIPVYLSIVPLKTPRDTWLFLAERSKRSLDTVPTHLSEIK